MPLIEIQNVSKIFKKGNTEIKPLHDIHVAINEGEFVALMGPSGSGKTTLLNLMAGIDTPTQGQVVIAGDTINRFGSRKLAHWRTRNIGYIFQLYHLIPVLTAFENIELPLTLLKMSATERNKRVQLVAQAVGMADRLDHFPRQLSGGQEQRVAIARAIVTDPKIILADEPTGDLDSHSAQEIMELVHRLHKDFNKTFVMVTHDQNVADQAERIIRLEKGFIVEGDKAKR